MGPPVRRLEGEAGGAGAASESARRWEVLHEVLPPSAASESVRRLEAAPIRAAPATESSVPSMSSVDDTEIAEIAASAAAQSQAGSWARVAARKRGRQLERIVKRNGSEESFVNDADDADDVDVDVVESDEGLVEPMEGAVEAEAALRLAVVDEAAERVVVAVVVRARRASLSEMAAAALDMCVCVSGIACSTAESPCAPPAPPPWLRRGAPSTAALCADASSRGRGEPPSEPDEAKGSAAPPSAPGSGATHESGESEEGLPVQLPLLCPPLSFVEAPPLSEVASAVLHGPSR